VIQTVTNDYHDSVLATTNTLTEGEIICDSSDLENACIALELMSTILTAFSPDCFKYISLCESNVTTHLSSCLRSIEVRPSKAGLAFLQTIYFCFEVAQKSSLQLQQSKDTNMTQSENYASTQSLLVSLKNGAFCILGVIFTHAPFLVCGGDETALEWYLQLMGQELAIHQQPTSDKLDHDNDSVISNASWSLGCLALTLNKITNEMNRQTPDVYHQTLGVFGRHVNKLMNFLVAAIHNAWDMTKRRETYAQYELSCNVTCCFLRIASIAPEVAAGFYSVDQSLLGLVCQTIGSMPAQVFIPPDSQSGVSNDDYSEFASSWQGLLSSLLIAPNTLLDSYDATMSLITALASAVSNTDGHMGDIAECGYYLLCTDATMLAPLLTEQNKHGTVDQSNFNHQVMPIKSLISTIVVAIKNKDPQFWKEYVSGNPVLGRVDLFFP
jgi:hypothetical protein